MKKYQKRAYRPEDYSRIDMAEAGRLAEHGMELPEIAQQLGVSFRYLTGALRAHRLKPKRWLACQRLQPIIRQREKMFADALQKQSVRAQVRLGKELMGQNAPSCPPRRAQHKQRGLLHEKTCRAQTERRAERCVGCPKPAAPIATPATLFGNSTALPSAGQRHPVAAGDARVKTNPTTYLCAGLWLP